jgi:hypothetical protein
VETHEAEGKDLAEFGNALVGRHRARRKGI